MDESNQTTDYLPPSGDSHEPIQPELSQKPQTAPPVRIYKMAPMRFNEMLSTFRRDTNMSQSRASELSGVEVQLISQLENGDFTQFCQISQPRRIEILRCLCNTYKSSEDGVLAAFQKEFTEFCANHGLYDDEECDDESADESAGETSSGTTPKRVFRRRDPLGQEDIDDSVSEPIQLPALLIKIAVLILVLLILAGWFYTKKITNEPPLTSEEADFSQLVPDTPLPMDTLSIPQ